MISRDSNDILNGVVLAGGKSVRMGQDKSTMQWHGVEQKYYIAGLLKPLCAETFISYREEPQEDNSGYTQVVDTYTGAGPYGAILSAFQKEPGAAWLVVACDLPLLDEATLEYLISNRNRTAIATTFESPHDGLPEPLITIWEPAAYPFLLAQLEEGFKCPRKALIKSDNVTILKAPDPVALMNANTPEDAVMVLDILRKTTVS